VFHHTVTVVGVFFVRFRAPLQLDAGIFSCIEKYESHYSIEI
jgi:hypothetical protein